MHITLMIKLDTRGKHNSREWFLGRSGFAEAYRSRYLMMTNAFTLFDIKCLWALTNYLDRNPRCSVVTGRQRAMTRRQQGKKHTEFKCRCTLIFNGKGRPGVEDSTTKWSVRVVAWLLYLINQKQKLTLKKSINIINKSQKSGRMIDIW